MTSEKLDKLCDVVQAFLEADPDLRIDDDKLAARVEAYYNPNIINLDYMEVRSNRYKYIKFSTESIRRARQAVQEKHEKLRPTREQILVRMAEEEEYRKFAKLRNYKGRHTRDGEE